MDDKYSYYEEETNYIIDYISKREFEDKIHFTVRFDNKKRKNQICYTREITDPEIEKTICLSFNTFMDNYGLFKRTILTAMIEYEGELIGEKRVGDNGRYHNKNFAKAALNHGCKVKYVTGRGYSIIALPEWMSTRTILNNKPVENIPRHVRELYVDYKKMAKRKNHEFHLTKEEFGSLIFQNCFYCGSEPLNIHHTEGSATKYIDIKYNGIDRVDSNKGYTMDNVVPCCKWCNMAKNDRTVDEFYKWIKVLANRIA